MKKIKAQKDILYVSISCFVVVAVWVATNIYHANVTSTIEPDLQTQIVPINPTFDESTIQKIKSRKKILPVFESKASSSEAELTPSPTIPEPTGAGATPALPTTQPNQVP